MRKDFEDDKQKAVSRAVAQAQSDIEAMRKQVEDKCKEDFTAEMKRISQKHKAEISATKKKQWVSRLTASVFPRLCLVLSSCC